MSDATTETPSAPHAETLQILFELARRGTGSTAQRGDAVDGSLVQAFVPAPIGRQSLPVHERWCRAAPSFAC